MGSTRKHRISERRRTGEQTYIVLEFYAYGNIRKISEAYLLNPEGSEC